MGDFSFESFNPSQLDNEFEGLVYIFIETSWQWFSASAAHWNHLGAFKSTTFWAHPKPLVPGVLKVSWVTQMYRLRTALGKKTHSCALQLWPVASLAFVGHLGPIPKQKKRKKELCYSCLPLQSCHI